MVNGKWCCTQQKFEIGLTPGVAEVAPTISLCVTRFELPSASMLLEQLSYSSSLCSPLAFFHFGSTERFLYEQHFEPAKTQFLSIFSNVGEHLSLSTQQKNLNRFGARPAKTSDYESPPGPTVAHKMGAQDFEGGTLIF